MSRVLKALEPVVFTVLLLSLIAGFVFMFITAPRRRPCNTDNENIHRAAREDDIERCVCTHVGKSSGWKCEWKDAFR